MMLSLTQFTVDGVSTALDAPQWARHFMGTWMNLATTAMTGGQPTIDGISVADAGPFSVISLVSRSAAETGVLPTEFANIMEIGTAVVAGHHHNVLQELHQQQLEQQVFPICSLIESFAADVVL